MDSKITIQSLLDERSRLQDIRANIASGCTLIQLGVNIPGINKNIYPSKALWKEGRKLLINLLNENNISYMKIIDNDTLLGNITWLVVKENSFYIKEICIKLEKQTSISSFLDIDVFAECGKNVGRSALDESPRVCFICNKPAKICAFFKNHSIDDLLSKIIIDFQDYISKKGL